MSETAGKTPLTKVGRCFVHPGFDYLFIGGGLSLYTIPFVYLVFGRPAMLDFSLLPWFILCSNSAHFAASTVRLYTKPAALAQLPFVAKALPIVTLVLLTLCMFAADVIGRYVLALYLIWSPYHYAAQAYGLAVMYCYRSGCRPSLRQKRWLWVIATLPFYKVLLLSLSKHVVPWLLPEQALLSDSPWPAIAAGLGGALGILSLVLPVVLFANIRRTTGQSVPMISILVILTNAVWFVVFPLLEGFIWTTIFHGIQYLAIVMIFHVRDHVAQPENRHSRTYHALWFYAVSLGFGYALFNCLPYGFQLLGFGATESVLLVIGAINIHHFIVDAFIWKLRVGDSNRQVVEDGSLSANYA